MNMCICTQEIFVHIQKTYFIVIVDNSQWEGSDKMQLAQFPLLQYNFIERSLSVFKNLQNLAKPLFFIYLYNFFWDFVKHLVYHGRL